MNLVGSYDGTYSDNDDTNRMSVALSPFVDYFLPGDSLRPLIGAHAGVDISSADQGGQELSGEVFVVGAAVGLHYFASSSVSLSPRVVLEGAFGSADIVTRAGALVASVSGVALSIGLAVSAWL